jgi:hypothetical protein
MSHLLVCTSHVPGEPGCCMERKRENCSDPLTCLPASPTTTIHVSHEGGRGTFLTPTHASPPLRLASLLWPQRQPCSHPFPTRTPDWSPNCAREGPRPGLPFPALHMKPSFQKVVFKLQHLKGALLSLVLRPLSLGHAHRLTHFNPWKTKGVSSAPTEMAGSQSQGAGG